MRKRSRHVGIADLGGAREQALARVGDGGASSVLVARGRERLGVDEADQRLALLDRAERLERREGLARGRERLVGAALREQRARARPASAGARSGGATWSSSAAARASRSAAAGSPESSAILAR